MITDSQFLKPAPIIDTHVHIVGTGAGGTGCWMRPKGWHRPLASLMLRHIGMDPASWEGDFDRLYLEKLLHFVGTSSLSHIVILAQDHVYEANGERMEGKGSFYVPNDYVLTLAEKHPRLLPAVSIHPARADAFEELDKCLDRGAVMMKCLPNCHNIDCSDRRYQRFWERMAEAGLPLLAHTGGEHTVPVIRREFADPRILELPLQCGVTVIAAHCGAKSGLLDPDYFNVFVKMTERFPNFYGDTSAFNVPIRGNHIPDCLRLPIRERVLHGSDYPVPVNGHFAWMRGLVPWAVFRRWQQQPNVLERDYQLKKAMGFSEESFGRVGRLLRKKK